MTNRKQALMDLLDKVEWGEAPKYTPDYELALWEDTGMWAPYMAMDAYDGSLDAAKALHEAVLPASASAVVDMEGDCDLYGGTGDNEWEWLRCSPCPNNPARAWLIAIIKALIDKETTQ